jgi:Putative collagen-binding domain of a collagenase
VAASITPSGSLAMLYLPNATTITINQSLMQSGYTATWVDPVSGATSPATPGSTYNSTAQGNNSQGDPDWVLVLQAPPQ